MWNFLFSSLMHPLLSIRLLTVQKRAFVILVVMISLLNNWGVGLDNKAFFRLTVSIQSLLVRMTLFIVLHEDPSTIRIEQVVVSPFYYLDDPYTIFDTYVEKIYSKFKKDYVAVDKQLLF